MDRAYDVDGAAQALEDIAIERIDNLFTKIHLAEITNVENWTTKYEPMQCGIPKVWRIVKQNPSTNSMNPCHEELVLMVQGIIAKKDLPPFQDKISSKGSQAQHLRQSITLVGSQTATFMRALQNVAEIHALFGRTVGHQNLQHSNIVSTYQLEPTLEMSNRYFTLRKQAELAHELTFPHDIDPNGCLRDAAGKHLVHIEDNIVQYYEQIKREASGDIKFVTAKLIKFQLGDIVEAQISFILIPQWENKFKSTMVLRTLTIMDGTFTQEAAKVHMQLQQLLLEKAYAVSSLKHNTGYADEEFGVTRYKMSKMRVEEHEDEGGWE